MNLDDMIYLDHAATTPMCAAAIAAMQPYLTDKFFNPSSPYAPAVAVRRDYESAKHRIAVIIGGRADDIIMTAGATESINLALTAAHDAHVVTTAIEHHAVLHAAERYENTIIAVDKRGVVDPGSVASAIRPDTQVVSVALANNEIGTIQPLRHIAAIVEVERNRRADAGENRPIWLHSDASQGVGQIDVNVARLGVDMITLNAGKFYGPKQVGILWRKPGVVLEPILYGGGQEMGLRSGTENVAGTIVAAAALEYADSRRKSESQRLAEMRDYLEHELAHAFETMLVSGHPKKRLPGSLHISFPGLDAERLIFRLEALGVMVATGSACAANSDTRSHVLSAIGMSDEQADGSLRLTLGRGNTSEQMERAAQIIIEEVRAEYERLAR